jgi:hypothetical protein
MSPRIHTTALAGATLALVAAAPLATGASSAPLRCHGLPVTVDSHTGVVHGTPKADVIRLTGRGTVYGGRGDDIICGSRRADTILAGGGDDIVLGGAGGDLIRGGDGRDRLYGEGGSDRIAGGRQRNTIVTGPGRRDVVADTALDDVSFDDYAISVRVPAAALAGLAEDGTQFAVARDAFAQPGRASGVPVAWTSFAPLEQNTISWDPGELSVYSAFVQPEPGSRIVPNASEPTRAGAAWTLSEGGISASGTSTTGPVSVRNPGFAPVVVGLAQPWTTNGTRGSTPLSATSVVPPSSTATLVPPAPGVAVFLTLPITPGSVAHNRPAYLANARPTPASPTATLNYGSGDFHFASSR